MRGEGAGAPVWQILSYYGHGNDDLEKFYSLSVGQNNHHTWCLWCFTFVRFTLVSLLQNIDYESYGGADILVQPRTTQRLAAVIGLQQKIVESIQ